MATNNVLLMERLKNVMLMHTGSSMETLLKVIKSDLFNLLSEYMILEPESLKISFEMDNKGAVNFYIDAKTNQIINAGYTLPD